MRKLSTLLLSFTAPFFFAQQAGDVVSFEKKLDLTPQGAINLIANSHGQESTPDFVNYLNGFNVGLKGYKITYYTKNENNILVKATGLVMYPNVNYKLSTVVSEHGTTDTRDNVPSNLSGPYYAGFVVELSYALNGYIVMAPDYVGMGTGEGKHPYVQASTEASATIDFVTAANKVLTQLNIKRYNEYFLTGYSQGAHASMSTLKKLSVSNPTNLNFKYAYMGDGPYDFSGVTFQKGIVEKEFYPYTAFFAYVVNSCNNIGYKTYTNNISEVISPEYLDTYNKNVIEEKGGLFWGPVIWRKMFTTSFINDATNNNNNKLRQCLRASDVFDWYNKTPTTLGHSSVDLAIHPENSSKTVEVQRGYYPWWDLNKYKLEAFYWGPLGHAGGVLPFILASNAKFNTLRSGGLFNQWAMLTSKQQGNSLPQPNPLYSSQLKPDLGNMQLVDITDFNQEKAAKRSGTEGSLTSLKDGVYLLKVKENNDQKLIPYIKNTPTEVPENEIIQSESNGILKLKVPQEELIAVNIFDENKNLLKTVSQKQYTENGGVDIKDIDNPNTTFEIVTQFYNLQFKKIQTGRSLANKSEIFTQNRQIKARAENGIKSISVYSISGALILQQEVNKPIFESKNLESGIYVVQMISADGKTVNKKVKL